jgi:hypothetical protein
MDLENRIDLSLWKRLDFTAERAEIAMRCDSELMNGLPNKLNLVFEN